MSTYKNILIAIDFNTEHENVIYRALDIAESTKDISLLFVNLPTAYMQPYCYGIDLEEFNDASHLGQAMEKLQVIAAKFDILKENVHVKMGNVADEIKQYAQEINADLIVIGTHGRSGIRLLLGSTANSVLHGVNCDVLAVRMYDDE